MAAKIFKDTYDYMINSGSPDWYLNITSEVNSIFLNDTIGLPLSSSVVSSSSSSSSSSTSSILSSGKGALINATTTLYSETSINDTLLLSLNNETETFTFNDTTNNGKSSISSSNNASSSGEDIAELIIMAATATILGLMILITVIGNVFVIAAIILERNLQNVANYLVASLAVADLFVACLVMPLGAVYEISKGWILGPELCDIWTSCDVLCCTASILHLVAIAVDRYWAVTNVDYIHSRTRSRVFTMICLVWFSAVIVSLAPQFGWKDPEYMERIEQQKCMVSQDVAYQVFATCSTFYVPLLVILVLYWKIYQTARKRIHRRRPRPIDITANNNQPTPQKTKKARLKLRLAAKFSTNTHGKSATSSLGLVEGNSTNTVNTVEDTDGSSNMDNKKCTEISTTAFNNATDENPPSTSQIATVSHLVTLENRKTKENQNSHQNQISSMPSSSSSPPPVKTKSLEKINNEKQKQQKEHQKQQPANLNTSKIAIISTDIATITTTATTTTTAAAATLSVQCHQSSSNQVTPIAQSKQVHYQQQIPATTAKSVGAIATTSGASSSCPLTSVPNPHTQVNKRKETLEAKRERKAAKTLAIITGAFVVCWLPFFLMALLLPLCGESCHINDTIASLFLWLGYFNSTLNPVIYTIFSPEFRQAFKRILFGGHRPVYYSSGKI